MNEDELGNKYGTNRCPKCGNPSLASEVCEKCKAPNLTKLIANKRAQLLAELSICEAATAGPWYAAGSWTILSQRNGGDMVANLSRQPDMEENLTFIATARTSLPDRIRENLRMLEALKKIAKWDGEHPDEVGEWMQDDAKSVLRDILTPKENV